jgi:hypothetical protein
MRRFHFEASKQEPLDYEATITSMVGETYEHVRYVSNDKSGEANCMLNLKNLVGGQKSKFSKPLFIGAKACMLQKKGMIFIYVLLAIDTKPQQHDIHSQYKDYKDVFEKKNVDTFPKHQPYDCTIDLEEGMQPPFGPIYKTYHKINLPHFENT